MIGIGYAGPYMRPYLDEAECCIAAMPAQQGVVAWPRGGRNSAALVDDDDLPFPDHVFDNALVVHALDHARDPEAVLRETWRVLVPGGRILVVIPNRRGLWARSEISPFGYGRPFSRRQIEALLRDCPVPNHAAAMRPSSCRPPVHDCCCAVLGHGRESAGDCGRHSPGFCSWKRKSRSIAEALCARNA